MVDKKATTIAFRLNKPLIQQESRCLAKEANQQRGESVVWLAHLCDSMTKVTFSPGFLYHNAPIKSKLQHPPPPGHLTIFCARGGREFDLQGLPGGGNLTFAWVWVEPEVSGFFFSGAEVANVFRRDGIN